MIAHFARSSRAWTAVAATLVLALGLVALTDAVQAEEPAKRSTRPAADAGQKTITTADGTIVRTNGPEDLVQRTVTVNGDRIATNDYQPAAERAPATGASDPNHRAPAAAPTDAEIARSDPTMRTYLERLAQLEDDRQRTGNAVGEKHPSVLAADAQIKQTKAFIAALGDQYRKQMMQPTKLKVGDLVAVSIMDLVGQGVETVKTARVDGDGTINLPYVGQLKAAGLSPRELEKAVGQALGDGKIVQNAVVAVSMPERGESHQLARRPAPGAVPGQPSEDPAMMGMEDTFMMEDPAMMGMAPPAAPVDAAAAALLGRKLPEVKFKAIPLGEVVQFLRDVTSANLFVNWRALEAAGIERSVPVTMQLRDVALKDVLALLVRDVGQGSLNYKVENGVIVIDVVRQGAKPAKLVTEAYNVSHLLGGGTEEQLKPGVAELQRVLMSNVQPRTWNDGASGISQFGLRLVVTAREDVHREIKQLLKMLERNGGAGGGNSAKSATQPAAQLSPETAQSPS